VPSGGGGGAGWQAVGTGGGGQGGVLHVGTDYTHVISEAKNKESIIH
jgi:hypothetical protein